MEVEGMMKGAVGLACLMCFCLVVSCKAAEQTATSGREAAATAFIGQMAAGDFAGAESAFDARLKEALPPDALAKMWKSLEAQAGPYQRCESTHAEKVEGLDLVIAACTFERGALDTKVVFNREGRIAGLSFAPHHAEISQSTEPLPAYLTPAGASAVKVSVGEGTEALPGMLTLPAGKGPFPVVILVHGSGPNDMDETIGPNKPFRDLAMGLAGQGVATLRYDKRTKAFPMRMAAIADRLTAKEEVVDDALAAVRFARADKRIDPDRIYVLGHSFGGYLAPRIGALDSRIAGLVIFAGNSRPLEDLVIDQSRYIFSLGGEMSEDTKARLAAVETQVARVKSPDFASAKLAPGELLLGMSQAYWLDLRGYDPVATAKKLRMSILVLWGERDYQITKADYDGWRSGLSKARNVTFKSYPALNHLFMSGEGKSTPAEYEHEGHVPEQVISDVSQWIKEQGSGAQTDSAVEGQR
jgi:uncharacterized protein